MPPITQATGKLDDLPVLATQASLRNITAHDALTKRIKALAQKAFIELDAHVFSMTNVRVGDRVHVGKTRREGELVYEILDYVMHGEAKYPWFLMGIVNKYGKVGKRTAEFSLICAVERV